MANEKARMFACSTTRAGQGGAASMIPFWRQTGGIELRCAFMSMVVAIVAVIGGY